MRFSSQVSGQKTNRQTYIAYNPSLKTKADKNFDAFATVLSQMVV